MPVHTAVGWRRQTHVRAHTHRDGTNTRTALMYAVCWGVKKQFCKHSAEHNGGQGLRMHSLLVHGFTGPVCGSQSKAYWWMALQHFAVCSDCSAPAEVLQSFVLLQNKLREGMKWSYVEKVMLFSKQGWIKKLCGRCINNRFWTENTFGESFKKETG